MRKTSKRTEGVAQVVEHRKCEALSSNSGTAKKKKNLGKKIHRTWWG
jgi:hypothetical protein